MKWEGDFRVVGGLGFFGFARLFFSVLAVFALLTFASYAHSERAYLQRNVALFVAVSLVLYNMWKQFQIIVRDLTYWMKSMTRTMQEVSNT